MLRHFHWLPTLLLAVGFLASLATLTARYQTEARSRAVALVLDYGQLRSLASATGVPIAVALRRVKSAGITGIAVTEKTLADLEADGSLDVSMAGSPGAREYRLRVSDPEIGGRLAEYLPHFVRGASRTPMPGDRVAVMTAAGASLYLPGRFEDLRLTPTCLDPTAVAEVHAAGLLTVGRLNNALGLTRESLRWDLEQVRVLGINTIIFAGEEVLGFSGLIDETAAAFRDLGLIYGSVEFGKQRGDERLAARLEDRLVRVHSIAAGEMPRLSPSEAIERYVRAAEERNIRLNYVRLPASASQSTFEDNLTYINQIARGLAQSGFGIAEPVPFGRVWPDEFIGRVPGGLTAAGVGAGALLLLAGILPISRERQARFSLVLAALCAGVVLSGVSIGLQLVALLAAVVFPTLAFVLFPQPVAAFLDSEHPAVGDRSQALVPAVAEFAAISFVTLVGAFMVAGLLSELPYLIKTKSFAGIKVATVIPVLLVGAIYLTGMSGEYSSWPEERDAVLTRLRGFFSEPVRVWHAVALIAGIVALALLVARSGNDAGIGVSPMELRLRALLDRVVGVRPRFKEFMVGHPALLLALALAVTPRYRVWAFPLLLVGIIGQVGMLNSFCHLHSPLKVTLLRTFNGLWMGGLIGLALFAIWSWVQSRLARHVEEPAS